MPSVLQDTLSLTESLPAADSLAVWQADSVSMAAQAFTEDPVAVLSVYGENSQKIAGSLAETASAVLPLTANVWFQALSIAVLALYCWMIYYYRNQIVMCLRGLVYFKPEDKFMAEQGHMYDGLIRFAMGMAMILFGMMAVKGIAAAHLPDIPADIPGWAFPAAAVAVACVIAAILALQSAILKFAGSLTLSEGLTGAVTQAKKLHLAAAGILTAPFIFLHTGLNPLWDMTMTYAAIIEIVVITVIFTVKTMLLFTRQKVSLLVWILYLCGVEIFPISFLVLLVAKNV